MGIWLLLTACVRYPGPIHHMGERPPPTAEGSDRRWLGRSGPRPVSPFQARIVDAADYYLEAENVPPRDDCSGLVVAIYTRAGMPVEGSVASLYDRYAAARALYRRKRPDLGDLVFFDNTFDRDGNGRLDDRLTHIGVVIAVDPYGTITIAQGGTTGGRTTLVMNLEHPEERTDAAGNPMNEPLRRKTPNDPPGTKYLASQMFRAFARVEPRTGAP